MKQRHLFHQLTVLICIIWVAALIVCFCLGLKQSIICLFVYADYLSAGWLMHIPFPDADVPEEWLTFGKNMTGWERTYRYLMAWPAIIVVYKMNKDKNRS